MVVLRGKRRRPDESEEVVDERARYEGRADGRRRRREPAYSEEKRHRMSRAEAVKLITTSNIKRFSGEEKGEDPEEILICAISTVLHKSALRWWRAMRDSVGTWREFRREFKSM